jgi:hypothetical protein
LLPKALVKEILTKQIDTKVLSNLFQIIIFDSVPENSLFYDILYIIYSASHKGIFFADQLFFCKNFKTTIFYLETNILKN